MRQRCSSKSHRKTGDKNASATSFGEIYSLWPLPVHREANDSASRGFAFCEIYNELILVAFFDRKRWRARQVRTPWFAFIATEYLKDSSGQFRIETDNVGDCRVSKVGWLWLWPPNTAIRCETNSVNVLRAASACA
jgi:hypothetical protein